MEKFFEVIEAPIGRLLRIALGIVLFYVGRAPLAARADGSSRLPASWRSSRERRAACS